jgi:hypothetical protein
LFVSRVIPTSDGGDVGFKGFILPQWVMTETSVQRVKNVTGRAAKHKNHAEIMTQFLHVYKMTLNLGAVYRKYVWLLNFPMFPLPGIFHCVCIL